MTERRMVATVACSRLVPAPADGLFRAGRSADVYRFSTDTAADVLDDAHARYGPRWEDPGAHVPTIYCASSKTAALGASLWMYRGRTLPDGRGLLQAIAETYGPADPGEPWVQAAAIPPSYFNDRVTARAEVSSEALFVDLAHRDTHAALAEALGFGRVGPATRFTRSTLFCGHNRRITRSVARHYHELSQTTDDNRIAGLRFELCGRPDWEFWALWQGAPLEGAHPWWVSGLDPPRPVSPEDPDLLAAAVALNLVVPH